MPEPIPNDDDVAAALNWLTQVDRPILQNVFASHREAAYQAGLLAGAKAMQWQPIATAPKDGTWILIRGRNSADYPMFPVVCRWSRSVHGSEPITWRDSASDRDMSGLIADVPQGSSADWMPLPDC